MRHTLLVIAPIVFLLASACAPAPAPAAGAGQPPEQITLTGTDDFRFNPSTITLKAGQPLQVTFQNSGEILHDFTVQQGLARPIVVGGGMFGWGWGHPPSGDSSTIRSDEPGLNRNPRLLPRGIHP